MMASFEVVPVRDVHYQQLVSAWSAFATSPRIDLELI
jgi:hypothetical protein